MKVVANLGTTFELETEQGLTIERKRWNGHQTLDYTRLEEEEDMY